MSTLWGDFTTQEEEMNAHKKGKSADQGGKKKGKSASMTTVSMGYRTSLNNLMSMLQATHPHFVRCLIPNEVKQSGLLDAALVMHQLTCNGVLEGIRICRKGFPNRTMHGDFRQRYAILAPEQAQAEDLKLASTQMMTRLVGEKKITEEEYRIGHTKVCVMCTRART
jgi:myosin heavy subunit